MWELVLTRPVHDLLVDLQLQDFLQKAQVTLYSAAAISWHLHGRPLCQ